MTEAVWSRALAALAQASAAAAETSTEPHLLGRIARLAREASSADFSAIYLTTHEHAAGRGPWRLVGHDGAEANALSLLPVTYGEGGGLLAGLLQAGRELREDDLLNGAPLGAALPTHFPARSLFGMPLRRRDGRAIGALLVGSALPSGFDGPSLTALRSMAQLAGVALDNIRLAAAQQRERRIAAESAVTLGTVLESVGSGVCVLDLDGTIRLANRALQDLFGLNGRVTGLPQDIVFRSAPAPPREADEFRARLSDQIADPSLMDQSEWELDTDPPRIVQRHAAPIRNLLGEVVGRVEVYTDITEERHLYTQLLHSEKLRAIGEMASGVAHDFNNLLASIVGQTELLPSDDLSIGTRQAVATIRQAALDGARMIRNMQDYARPHADAPRSVADLNETVRVAVEMARPRWARETLRGRGMIDLQVDLEEGDGGQLLVSIDPAELREVLLNLLFNAADAMSDGGHIHVATRRDGSGRAELLVRDTGHGMTDAVRERIFEPFYSTKGAGGSGLGLAVAYSIITRHGGEIGVESTVGQGTSFTIQLRLAPGLAAGAELEPTIGISVSTATRRLAGTRVLVVDDEPSLLAVVRQLLERSGAAVATADGGQTALEALGVPGAVFDVVVTDLDMPEVDGWAVAEHAKRQSPQRPVVMLTGWAGEVPPDEFRRRGVDVVLAKPCRRVDLEDAIEPLLRSPQPVPPAAPGGRGLRVLVAEDEAVFAQSLRDLLALLGNEVDLVGSAAEALEALEQRSYDVLLTDYRLGDITGAQLAERLADWSERPFVALITGYATQNDDPGLRTRGVDSVLTKPCRKDDLRLLLERAGQGRVVSAR